MSATPINPSENYRNRLVRLTAIDALTLDLVSAFSGDRELLQAEKLLLEHIQKKRGALFFSDILFVITHQYFHEHDAEDVWNHILKHKYDISAELKRNVRLGVAALDYLSNFTTAMQAVTLISEADIWDIIRLAQHDGLTGLFNHAHFYNSLHTQMLYCLRYNTNVSLLMLDIDDFKRLNDKYGHQEGDAVLSALGALLDETARASDICCRYGGEEFAVILPLTQLPQAAVMAERIRSRVDSLPLRHKVTVSVGAASSGRGVFTTADLVKKADDALYAAKSTGKNKVVVYPCGQPGQDDGQ